MCGEAWKESLDWQLKFSICKTNRALVINEAGKEYLNTFCQKPQRWWKILLNAKQKVGTNSLNCHWKFKFVLVRFINLLTPSIISRTLPLNLWCCHQDNSIIPQRRTDKKICFYFMPFSVYWWTAIALISCEHFGKCAFEGRFPRTFPDRLVRIH